MARKLRMSLEHVNLAARIKEVKHLFVNEGKARRPDLTILVQDQLLKRLSIISVVPEARQSAALATPAGPVSQLGFWIGQGGGDACTQSST